MLRHPRKGSLALFGLIAPVILIMGASGGMLKKKNEYQERYLEAELEYVKPKPQL